MNLTLIIKEIPDSLTSGDMCAMLESLQSCPENISGKCK
uniref:Uncharacterized protein n=1 Tax=Klebsiella pneumoniae TaxID=573 RepID=A0A1J0QZS1_KLEPN|nr:hypothetical protein [Klebsiella pneumoniae]